MSKQAGGTRNLCQSPQWAASGQNLAASQASCEWNMETPQASRGWNLAASQVSRGWNLATPQIVRKSTDVPRLAYLVPRSSPLEPDSYSVDPVLLPVTSPSARLTSHRRSVLL